MKFSSCLALCGAPAVLAKAVQNVYPEARDRVQLGSRASSDSSSKNNKGGKGAAPAAAAAANNIPVIEIGGGSGSGGEVIIIWINNGAGAGTSTVNAQQTVTRTLTQTVTATAGAGGGGGGGSGGSQTTKGVSTTTVATTGTTHSVMVGGGAAPLSYTPDTINAAIGDMVVFTFMSQNHTVSQSAFDTPCKLLQGGMDSGFMPNPNNTVTPPPQMAMQVMVSTPLWFYCRQKGHCGKGMVMSINPTANKTQALFQSMAIAQNGTGTAAPINGGSGAGAGAGSAAAAAKGSSSAAAVGAAAATQAAGAKGAGSGATKGSATKGAGSSATAAASSSSGSVSTGSGAIGAGGACQCAVVCAAGSFPDMSAQGVNNFGGLGGGLPATMAVVV